MFHNIIAPSSSPSNVTVVSICATSLTVNWMYDTSDADGYVVHYNDTAKLVVGGDVKETTLDGLIPGTSYSITVRAYQDILGPPSDTISRTLTIGNVPPYIAIMLYCILGAIPYHHHDGGSVEVHDINAHKVHPLSFRQCHGLSITMTIRELIQ